MACEADCDDQTLTTLLYEAVAASPLNGLARGVHPSLFTLVHNGKVLTPAQVTPLDAAPFANPGDNFPKLVPARDSTAVPDLIEVLTENSAGYEAFAKTRTRASPDLGADKQLLHMHSRCVLRSDGVKEIYKEQYGPEAPSWKFLSDEEPPNDVIPSAAKVHAESAPEFNGLACALFGGHRLGS